MAYLIGAALAVATLLLARFAQLDRIRGLYPVLLIVVASFYELFAAIGGPANSAVVEGTVMFAFIAVALIGFRRSSWVVVIGLAAHGLFDALHPMLVDNDGVPNWWPAFCLSFDFAAALLLAVQLVTSRTGALVAFGNDRPRAAPGTLAQNPHLAESGSIMRRRLTLPLSLLSLIGLTTAATLWASTVPPSPLARDTAVTPARPEKVEPYRARFGHQRPLIAIVGENSATELTDFVIPYGILAEADVADLVTVSTAPGVVNMRPALHLQVDTTMAAFDAEHPQGADYVIVPAMVRHDDRQLSRWIAAQSAKGATIVSICDGALVVANAGLMDNHRATAHWATLSYRREHFPNVTWVENSRYVADGRIVSSAGISAAIPTSLALVEAIAGPEKAAAVARALHVSEWSSRHDSQVFAPSFGRNLTAFATTMAINPRLRRNEAVGIPIAAGTDDIALAITADGYSRTGRGKAYATAATADPVRTRHGLIFLPDRVHGRNDAFDRVVQLPDVHAGEQLDAVLALIERDYGRLTAFGVALEFEYPGFQ